MHEIDRGIGFQQIAPYPLAGMGLARDQKHPQAIAHTIDNDNRAVVLQCLFGIARFDFKLDNVFAAMLNRNFEGGLFTDGNGKRFSLFAIDMHSHHRHRRAGKADILDQNATLQTSANERNQHIEHLHTISSDIRLLRTEAQRDATDLRTLTRETQDVTDNLTTTMRTATQLQQTIEADTRTTVHTTIQQVVDSKMAQVETAIHNQLQKKGRSITGQIKMEMAQHIDVDTRIQHLEAQIELKTDTAYDEAASLLDQAVMRIGDEMNSAVDDFRTTLSSPPERTRYIERLVTQAMHDIRS